MCTVRRWGFKSRKQLPLFMIWEEEWLNGKIVYARVIFNSMNYRCMMYKYSIIETVAMIVMISVFITLTGLNLLLYFQ